MRDKSKHQRWYRRPHTTQEKRVNGKRSKWGRAKRNQVNLPDPWDDKPTCIQKTWKVKRCHQHYAGGRGKEHKVFLPADGRHRSRWQFWLRIYDLEEYFRSHDIPYKLEEKNESVTKVKTHQQVYRITGWEPYTYVRAIRHRKNGAKKTETRYVTETAHRPIHQWVSVPLPTPREYTESFIVGYTLTWWHDKDIGLEHILQECLNHYSGTTY